MKWLFAIMVMVTISTSTSMSGWIFDKSYYIERLELIKEKSMLCQPQHVPALDVIIEDFQEGSYNHQLLGYMIDQLTVIANTFDSQGNFKTDYQVCEELDEMMASMRNTAAILERFSDQIDTFKGLGAIQKDCEDIFDIE